jgi:hypothetical protein
MGIYDISWIDDSSFFSCSADNSVKSWSLDSDTAVKEFKQGEKRKVPKQLLAVINLEDGVVAVNLNGDLIHWSKDGDLTI